MWECDCSGNWYVPSHRQLVDGIIGIGLTSTGDMVHSRTTMCNRSSSQQYPVAYVKNRIRITMNSKSLQQNSISLPFDVGNNELFCCVCMFCGFTDTSVKIMKYVHQWRALAPSKALSCQNSPPSPWQIRPTSHAHNRAMYVVISVY